MMTMIQGKPVEDDVAVRERGKNDSLASWMDPNFKQNVSHSNGSSEKFTWIWHTDATTVADNGQTKLDSAIYCSVLFTHL